MPLTPPPQCGKQKCFQIFPKVPQGTTLALDNHWPKPRQQTFLLCFFSISLTVSNFKFTSMVHLVNFLHGMKNEFKFIFLNIQVFQNHLLKKKKFSSLNCLFTFIRKSCSYMQGYICNLYQSTNPFVYSDINTKLPF